MYDGASMSEAQAFAGEDVYVVGGGNSAGQAALHLARYAGQVTILVRSASLAASMSQYLIEAIGNTPNLAVRYATEVAGAHGEGRLQRLELLDTQSRETSAGDAAAPTSSSSAPCPTPAGCRRRSPATTGATSSRAPKPERDARSKRASPACSQPATCGRVPYSGSQRRSATAPWP